MSDRQGQLRLCEFISCLKEKQLFQELPLCFSATLDECQRQEETLSTELEQGRRRSEEITQDLGQVLEELRNARLDSHESKRQLQSKELLEKLFRLYPEAVVGDTETYRGVERNNANNAVRGQSNS